MLVIKSASDCHVSGITSYEARAHDPHGHTTLIDSASLQVDYKLPN